MLWLNSYILFWTQYSATTLYRYFIGFDFFKLFAFLLLLDYLEYSYDPKLVEVDYGA